MRFAWSVPNVFGDGCDHDSTQSHFAALLGVSVRTLQGWEQGRNQPSGAARTLLTIARANPRALLAVAGKYAHAGRWALNAGSVYRLPPRTRGPSMLRPRTLSAKHYFLSDR